MISSTKLKSVDFYRKIPRDLTEASLSGAGLSIIAALAMIFLFGMELSNYLTITATTSVIVDQSTDGDFMHIDFNISFPALSCEFASVDMSDVLGTSRLNITKTIRKFSIDQHLNPTGKEFHSGPDMHHIKHGEEFNGELVLGSVPLDSRNFNHYSQLFPVLVVNFFAPWCYWSNRLKPSWETAAKMLRERYDPQMDGRILLGSVDCTIEVDLCKRHHVQGYPSIRIFRKGSDLKEERGNHDHEAYYGDRDTDSLYRAMENLVTALHMEPHLADNKTFSYKRPAPLTGGCRIEGYVHAKKVPGNLIISARSGVHSFDPSQMNMSHVIDHFSFGMRASAKLFNEAVRMIPYLGGSHDKLQRMSFINHHASQANVTIEHYLQVVKTEVRARGSKEYTLIEYEYTVHSSLVESVYVPVTIFQFAPSPLQVLIVENSRSFSHFLTNVCAIIGGVFTVAGILDSVLHNTVRLMKKVELGKNF